MKQSLSMIEISKYGPRFLFPIYHVIFEFVIGNVGYVVKKDTHIDFIEYQLCSDNRHSITYSRASALGRKQPVSFKSWLDYLEGQLTARSGHSTDKKRRLKSRLSIKQYDLIFTLSCVLQYLPDQSSQSQITKQLLARVLLMRL